MGAGGCRTDDMFARGVGVASPESVPRGRVVGWVRGEGEITFVRLGRGEEGRLGGEWGGKGVSDIELVLSVVVVVLLFVGVVVRWCCCFDGR